MNKATLARHDETLFEYFVQVHLSSQCQSVTLVHQKQIYCLHVSSWLDSSIKKTH